MIFLNNFCLKSAGVIYFFRKSKKKSHFKNAAIS